MSAHVRLLVWDRHTARGSVVEAVAGEVLADGSRWVQLEGRTERIWPEEYADRTQRALVALRQVAQREARGG